MALFGYESISVLDHLGPDYRIGVRKNQNMQITVPKADHEIITTFYKNSFCFFQQYLQMNAKVIKRALGILQENNSKSESQRRWDLLDDKLKQISSAIERMEKALSK